MTGWARRLILYRGSGKTWSGWRPRCGRSVVTDITVLKDPPREVMLKAMNAFGKRLSNSEKTSLFYYSGHGVLQDKLNYLIPAKAQVMARGHLKNYAVPFEHVTGFVGQQTKGPCLFFIDACRNNTLPAGNKASSDGSLLVQRKGGVFVGFATGEGQTSQASLTGSPYTESLSKRLLLPGASLDDLYFSVIADVEKVTNEDPEYFQPPEKVSGLRYRFTLVSGAGVPVPPVRPIPAAPAPQIAATKEKALFQLPGDEVRAGRDAWSVLQRVGSPGG